MINWSIEYPQIEQAAANYGVDPYFIAAIRHAENGAAGLEFGDEAARGGTYWAQLIGACATVRNKLVEYIGNPFDLAQSGPVKRLVYSKGFIAWFANKYAPVGAVNDPNGVNVNWPNNAMLAYAAAVALRKVQ